MHFAVIIGLKKYKLPLKISNTKLNFTLPSLSVWGHGRVLPPQNSVGSPGYTSGLGDVICRPHSSMAALLCHLVHGHIRLSHHHRHRGLLHRTVRFGALRLRETQGLLVFAIVWCYANAINLFEVTLRHVCLHVPVWVFYVVCLSVYKTASLDSVNRLFAQVPDFCVFAWTLD